MASKPMAMDQGAERWMLKACHRDHWKVELIMDKEDLIQEGYVCWSVITSRYPDKTPAHTMALFITTFTRRIIDLAALNTKYRDLYDRAVEFDDAVEALGLRRSVLNDAMPTFKKPPSYVSSFLWLISQPVEKIFRIRSPYRFRIDGTRETTHEHWCRLIRHDPSTTPRLPEAIVAYFDDM